MKNYLQAGDSLTVTAPYAVTSGQGVLVGGIFGIAAHDAAISTPVTIKRTGVFENMVKETHATTQAWTDGMRLFWDNTARRFTITATSNLPVAFAKGAVASTVAVGTVLLGHSAPAGA